MIARAFTLTCMLGGSALCSQYPAFAQDYLQRLGGQVDALTAVVTDFETSAMRAGLTRTQALEQMTGTPFLTDRKADMRATFRRHAVLSDDLARLRAANPIARIALVHRLSDPATLRGTWGDFVPALPLTAAGALTAALGAALGWLLARLIRGVIAFGRPARRDRVHQKPRRRSSTPGPRAEPSLATRRETASPRLSGVRRSP